MQERLHQSSSHISASVLERGLYKDEKKGASSGGVLSLIFEAGARGGDGGDDKAYIIVSPKNMW